MQSAMIESFLSRLAWCAAATVVAAGVWLAAPTRELFLMSYRPVSECWEVAGTFFLLMLAGQYLLDRTIREGRPGAVLIGMWFLGYLTFFAAECLLLLNELYVYEILTQSDVFLQSFVFILIERTFMAGAGYYGAFLAMVHRSLPGIVRRAGLSSHGLGVAVNTPDEDRAPEESRLKRLLWSGLATALGACIMLSTPLFSSFYFRIWRMDVRLQWSLTFYGLLWIVMYCSSKFIRKDSLPVVVMVSAFYGIMIGCAWYTFNQFSQLPQRLVFAVFASSLHGTYVNAVIVALLCRYLPRLVGWVTNLPT
ncbi:hypothetical protein NNJEOMEG_04014 [Fundidesulfovibrio magnetotacticus]|uniref:Uncharacterized protein n=1 Tax=Fundidesulfovibrio magnetotacticus TaxID=2730080 RepID=A0A6V8LWM0_9BACT|nr:hypothetical protein [Fundidesulfovibrio magnetotacticus]GFK96134.1 hypothetical protein NNJEOMEG_04014 [Fundidesulfovibrio magnetotacticus]